MRACTSVQRPALQQAFGTGLDEPRHVSVSTARVEGLANRDAPVTAATLATALAHQPMARSHQVIM